MCALRNSFSFFHPFSCSLYTLAHFVHMCAVRSRIGSDSLSLFLLVVGVVQKIIVLGRHLQLKGGGEREEPVWVVVKFRGLFYHFEFTRYRGTAVQASTKITRSFSVIFIVLGNSHILACLDHIVQY